MSLQVGEVGTVPLARPVGDRPWRAGVPEPGKVLVARPLVATRRPGRAAFVAGAHVEGGGLRAAVEDEMPKGRDTSKTRDIPQSKGEGDMTVREAGRMGGHKGGQRVKELIEEGKRSEGEKER